MYNSSLDGLRGFAVILVMISHANRDLAHAGWVGVEIFFILSGYLITGSIQKNNLKEFFVRRIFRILPALSVFLTLYLSSSFFLNFKNDSNLIISIVLFFSNWLFAYNLVDQKYITHLWSLALEEQFYLILPWLLISIRFNKNILFLIFLFFFLYKVHFIFLGDFQRFYYGTDTRLSSFILGSLVYLVRDKFLKNNFIFNNHQILSILIIIILLSISFLEIGKNTFAWVFLSNISLFLLILVFTRYDKNYVFNIFSHNFLIFFGKISFSLYLFHGFIFSYLLYEKNFSSTEVFILGGSISIFLSFVNYKYIEDPCINFSKKILEGRRTLYEKN